MRFDSAEFLFFLGAVLALHWIVPTRRALLIGASYSCYSSWNPPFLLLLLASTALDYSVGRRLQRTSDPTRRRAWLLLSLLGNLGVLGYFKYVNFFLDNLVALGTLSPGWADPLRVHTAIPLGISFYTFQTISYSIDVYRRKIEACEDPMDFALFVSFFPQLIAGPILRAAEFLPQLRRHRLPGRAQVLDGVELCLVGLFKKIVIADSFALVVDRCFGAPELYSGEALLIAIFAFSAQIYCDFSGYTTMARGMAKLLGFELPENFFFPLLAGNPIDYRRGWHMTMGNWFRDYLYRPLGGDRGTRARVVFNTVVTWMAFGLWHGASWNFVVWGMYNGLLLAAYRLLKSGDLLPDRSRLATAIGYLSMPFFVAFANVFFRAQSIDSALLMLTRITTWAPGDNAVHLAWAAGLALLYAWHWGNKKAWPGPHLSRLAWPARAVYLGGFLWVLMLFAGSGQPFYYFQF